MNTGAVMAERFVTLEELRRWSELLKTTNGDDRFTGIRRKTAELALAAQVLRGVKLEAKGDISLERLLPLLFDDSKPVTQRAAFIEVNRRLDKMNEVFGGTYASLHRKPLELPSDEDIEEQYG